MPLTHPALRPSRRRAISFAAGRPPPGVSSAFLALAPELPPPLKPKASSSEGAESKPSCMWCTRVLAELDFVPPVSCRFKRREKEHLCKGSRDHYRLEGKEPNRGQKVSPDQFSYPFFKNSTSHTILERYSSQMWLWREIWELVFTSQICNLQL